MKHLTTIHIHWEDSEDHPTFYINGEKLPQKIIDKLNVHLVHRKSIDGEYFY